MVTIRADDVKVKVSAEAVSLVQYDVSRQTGPLGLRTSHTPRVTTGHHRSPQVVTGHHRSSRVTTGHHRSPRVTTGHHGSPRVTTGHHSSPQVTTGHHRSPRVITGHHGSSRVITGQMQTLMRTLDGGTRALSPRQYTQNCSDSCSVHMKLKFWRHDDDDDDDDDDDNKGVVTYALLTSLKRFMKRGPKRQALWRPVYGGLSSTHGHDSVHQAAVLLGALLALQGPAVQGGANLGLVCVQQPEARHVDPAIAEEPGEEPDVVLTCFSSSAAVRGEQSNRTKNSLSFLSSLSSGRASAKVTTSRTARATAVYSGCRLMKNESLLSTDGCFQRVWMWGTSRALQTDCTALREELWEGPNTATTPRANCGTLVRFSAQETPLLCPFVPKSASTCVCGSASSRRPIAPSPSSSGPGSVPVAEAAPLPRTDWQYSSSSLRMSVSLTTASGGSSPSS
ncbi:hypothetical protein CRUP_000142 [Coryphaenoides rupestris]|nr:hypothetical protein CRUP_000142 [Coryphaenoides rupestris]